MRCFSKISSDKHIMVLGVLQCYGGNHYANIYLSIVTYDRDRIVGLKLESKLLATIFECVFLPYDCSDNFDDYNIYLLKFHR